MTEIPGFMPNSKCTLRSCNLASITDKTACTTRRHPETPPEKIPYAAFRFYPMDARPIALTPGSTQQ
ncbi:hypothetical protein SAMD00023353_0300330 [Rosellinia necatrix]|uniref:Uncharacterized protein n=1 Tax=Rosellinia necatrix TaxID=77044 RepID=A0A1S8A594_ROSNE|nr:hypothetical protein SAMD00023353_0300330 [Rosellinia necatrix]